MSPPQEHSDLEGSLSHDSNDESDYHDHHSEPRNHATTRSTKSGSSSKKKPANSRRASHQADDGAGGHHHDDPADPQNARKMQNRLAQREFRARRLEHIKELEARVEFLSKPQSEQTDILVAIIHGLMDENKQLRGALKTMAGFVSTGAGGLSNALHFSDYDNALDLVNRGDRALLLKLVQEKGALVGGGNNHTDQNNPQPSHNSSTATNAHKDSSPPTSASTTASRPQHTDKKRKSSQETHTENSSSKSSSAKAPRTRSQNTRGRQDTTTASTATSSNSSGTNVNKSDWQHSTPRDTPPIPSSTSIEHNFAQQEASQRHQQFDNRPVFRSAGGPSHIATTQPHQGRETRMMDMFPPVNNGSVGSLGSFDIFGDNATNQSTDGVGNSSSTPSNASSAFAPGTSTNVNSMGVKEEDSPPLLPYQDPASAWMNAYTNLTPMGEFESFWSLNSSAMALQGANSMSCSSVAQQQQQQPKRNQQEALLDAQDGRSPSLTYNPNWGMPGQLLTSNNLNSFSAPQQSMQRQRPLHGFA